MPRQLQISFVSASCKLGTSGPWGSRFVLNSSSDMIEQPPSVNTVQKCREACLGPNSDGVLSSGHGCVVAQFNNGRCRIATLGGTLSNSIPDNSVYSFLLEWKCTSSLYPGKYL